MLSSYATNPQEVVIVGGGFAGVRLALSLSNNRHFDVKLISKQSYFEYHAALYRSATGRSPLEVALPLSDLFADSENVEVIVDTVSSIQTDTHTVIGATGSHYHYDKLVMALGSVTGYFNIPGLAEYAFNVKTIQEALELKRHLHEQLLDTKREEHNYVVIGGGATGVELAGELVGYIARLRRNHHIRHKQFTVTLLEAGDHLMPLLPVAMSNRIADRLRKLGVDVRLGTAVKAETAAAIKLPGGQIHSHTVIWTAGVTNNPLFAAHPDLFTLGKGGRVVVNQYLEASPNVYVIGDSAATTFSGMAQTALHDASLVATNPSSTDRNDRFTPSPSGPIGRPYAGAS
jgi:NADH dehydrogenase